MLTPPPGPPRGGPGDVDTSPRAGGPGPASSLPCPDPARLLCWSQSMEGLARDSKGPSVLSPGPLALRSVGSPDTPIRHLHTILCSRAFLTPVTAALRPCHLECWKKTERQPGDPSHHYCHILPAGPEPTPSGACSSLISLLNGPPFPFPSSVLKPTYPASHLKSPKSLQYALTTQPAEKPHPPYAHAGVGCPHSQTDSGYLPARGPLTDPPPVLSSLRCTPGCLPAASCGPSNPGPPFSLLLLLCVPLGPQRSWQLSGLDPPSKSPFATLPDVPPASLTATPVCGWLQSLTPWWFWSLSHSPGHTRSSPSPQLSTHLKPEVPSLPKPPSLLFFIPLITTLRTLAT